MVVDWLPASVTDRELGALRIALAVAGFALMTARNRQRRRGEGTRSVHATRVALMTVAALSMASYYNFFIWAHGGGGHIHELFHYYLGSKYAHELGYTRIYECATVADAEDGLPPEVVNEPIRDLVTKEIVSPARLLADPERCTGYFSASRWATFKSDLAWFRRHMTPSSWAHIRQDHGYNPSPVWTLLGGAVASRIPATDEGMRWAMQLDLFLVGATFISIGWAFGLDTLALAAIAFGTSFPARYAWTGDAFLRQMWFSSALIGIGLIRRRHSVAGGALLAVSALLRIFPVLFFAGPGWQAVVDLVRHRRITGQPMRIAIGAILAVGILGPWSIHAAGRGLSVVSDFAMNTSTLIHAPAANRVGLRSLLTFRGERPEGTIRNGIREITSSDLARQQQETWQTTRYFYFLIVAGVALLFVQGASRASSWEAAAMGCTLIPILTDPASYYASFLTAAAFLATRRPRIGLALMLNSAAGWLAYFSFEAMDQQYAASTLPMLFLCVYVLFEMREPPAFDETVTPTIKA